MEGRSAGRQACLSVRLPLPQPATSHFPCPTKTADVCVEASTQRRGWRESFAAYRERRALPHRAGTQQAGRAARLLLLVALGPSFGTSTQPAEHRLLVLALRTCVWVAAVQAMPEKADTPSNFTLKLRKHIRWVPGMVACLADAHHMLSHLRLFGWMGRAAWSPLACPPASVPVPARTRRLEAVKQLGVDRIVQLSFGSGPASCHLLLEFYAQASGRRQGELCFGTCMHPCAVQHMPLACCSAAALHAATVSSFHRAGVPPPPRPTGCTVGVPQGNVILADDKFEVLTLLRSHRWAAAARPAVAVTPLPLTMLAVAAPVMVVTSADL